MTCPTCGLDNDPSAGTCARCNTALVAPPPPAWMSAPGPAPGPPPGPPPGPAPGLAPAFDPLTPRRDRMPVIAVAAVVVLIAVVAAAIVVYRRGGDGDGTTATSVVPPANVPAATAVAEPTEPVATTAAGDPKQQVRVIDALLTRSVASRNKLNQAIDRVNRCTDLSGALSDMRAVGDERRDQISAVAKADLSALTTGETLRSALTRALQHSLDADRAYVSWAEPTLSRGCANTASRNAAYSRGRSASTQAGDAKTAFLALWNPVATNMGLPARSRDKI